MPALKDVIVYVTHRLFDPHAVAVQLSIGGRAGIAKASVGVLVPVLRAREVGLGAVGPEDRTDGLGTTIRGERLWKW